VTQAIHLKHVQGFLDEALIALRDVENSELPRHEAEAWIGRALRHVYRARAERADVQTSMAETERAKEALGEALYALQAQPTDDAGAARTAGCAARALGALSRLTFELDDDVALPRRGDKKPLVQASRVTPRLLDPSRDLVTPSIPLEMLAEAPPDPDRGVKTLFPPPRVTLAELQALAEANLAKLEALDSDEHAPVPPPSTSEPQTPAPPPADEVERVLFGVAITDYELRLERARECLEDLAMLGRMRRPVPDEPWTSGATSEDRLLTKVDAIAAAGWDVWSALVRLLDDRPLPDPELTFANVFFLSCIAGDDTFDEAMRLVRISDLDDVEMSNMIVDALVFSPHPRVEPKLVSWLDHPDAGRRVLAIEALRRRNAFPAASLDPLSRDEDLRVIASAARAVRSVPDADAYAALPWFLHHDDEEVVRAALESAAWLRAESGYIRAAALVESGKVDFAGAILFVAISGRSDARPLLEARARKPSKHALRALGWFGDASHVPLLIERLADDAEQAAALAALERITGASLTEASPEPKYTEDTLPFAARTSAYEPPSAALADPAAWTAFWQTHGRRAKRDQLYRWGRPWSVALARHELEHRDFLFRDRELAAMEHNLRGQRRLRFEPHAFIASQRRALEEHR
jgi:hypothetical protein